MTAMVFRFLRQYSAGIQINLVLVFCAAHREFHFVAFRPAVVVLKPDIYIFYGIRRNPGICQSLFFGGFFADVLIA